MEPVSTTTTPSMPGATASLEQLPGINSFSSPTLVDPTTQGPWGFTIDTENLLDSPFLPEGATVLAVNAENSDEWVFGYINIYNDSDPTLPVLYVRKAFTSVQVSTNINSWLISVIDGPQPLDKFSIIGLKVTQSQLNWQDIIVSAGSVLDSTGQVLLTLPTAMTKKLNLTHAVGDNQGAFVQTANLAGTVSFAGGFATGVGTAFLNDFGTFGNSILTDLAEQYANWANGNPRSNGGVIARGATVDLLLASDNFSGVLQNTAGAVASGTYKRGGWVTGRHGLYATVVAQRETDGLIDIFSVSMNGTGEPDLPSGWGLYRVLADILTDSTNSALFITQPLRASGAPSATEIYDNPAERTYLITGNAGDNLYEADLLLVDQQTRIESLEATIGAMPVIAAGNYTPTLVAAVNLDSVTAQLCYYQRIGDVVKVEGRCNVNPTAAGAARFRVSLPVASAFSSVLDAHGLGTGVAQPGETGTLSANVAADDIDVDFTAVNTANHGYNFSFMYRVRI